MRYFPEMNLSFYYLYSKQTKLFVLVMILWLGLKGYIIPNTHYNAKI